jgi:hypothetical protein
MLMRPNRNDDVVAWLNRHGIDPDGVIDVAFDFSVNAICTYTITRAMTGAMLDEIGRGSEQVGARGENDDNAGD